MRSPIDGVKKCLGSRLYDSIRFMSCGIKMRAVIA